MAHVIDFEGTNMVELKDIQIRRAETASFEKIKKSIKTLRITGSNDCADELVRKVKNNPDKYFAYHIYVNGKNFHGGATRLETKKIFDEAMRQLTVGAKVINLRKIAADVCGIEIVHDTDEYGRMKKDHIIIRPV